MKILHIRLIMQKLVCNIYAVFGILAQERESLWYIETICWCKLGRLPEATTKIEGEPPIKGLNND